MKQLKNCKNDRNLKKKIIEKLENNSKLEFKKMKI